MVVALSRAWNHMSEPIQVCLILISGFAVTVILLTIGMIIVLPYMHPVSHCALSDHPNYFAGAGGLFLTLLCFGALVVKEGVADRIVPAFCYLMGYILLFSFVGETFYCSWW